jgi:hypothetical protein
MVFGMDAIFHAFKPSSKPNAEDSLSFQSGDLSGWIPLFESTHLGRVQLHAPFESFW